ncbi:MAG: transposase [Candidatus Levybacteria bacterium]|nr:transposase [Candidatus Levybacteria bacterium]
MRAYQILPTQQIRTAALSKAALKRLTWIDWYHTHGKKVRATCRHFSLSFETFYLWKKRFDEKGLGGLEDDTKTRRPQKLRQMTIPQLVIDRIVAIRSDDPEKSKYEIQAELKDDGMHVGYNTIQKVINRNPKLKNLQHKKKVKKKRHYQIARIKAAKELRDKTLGSLVQVDTQYFSILGARYFIFSAIDCKSRFGFIYPYLTISSASARDFVKKVRAYFPFPIQAIQTDNGSECLLQFHQEITSWGIPHYFSDPYCPKQNGRVERFHQTVEYEYMNYQPLLPYLTDFQKQCLAFNRKYNYQRYHAAIGYQRPGDYVMLLLKQERSVT